MGWIFFFCVALQRCHCQSLVLSALRLVAGADQRLVESHWDGQYGGNSGHLWFWGRYPALYRIGQGNNAAVLLLRCGTWPDRSSGCRTWGWTALSSSASTMPMSSCSTLSPGRWFLRSRSGGCVNWQDMQDECFMKCWPNVFTWFLSIN